MTTTVRLGDRTIELDADNRAYCDHCQEWRPLVDLLRDLASGASGHRVRSQPAPPDPPPADPQAHLRRRRGATEVNPEARWRYIEQVL